jgi:iron complex transport system substrate-binding protein
LLDRAHRGIIGVVTANAPDRIVSLLASGTELVCALGLGERLVGRSHECDYPGWVTRLPVLSHPTFDVTGSSAEIDARVRAKLSAGAPLYEIDEASLTALAPDVIITQTHCEVCAVSAELVEAELPPGVLRFPRRQPAGPPPVADPAHGTAPRLERRPVVALAAGTIDGILEGFIAVADVLGVSDAGHALVDGIRARLDSLAAATSPLPRPRVACLEWIAPVFAMGNWGPELVAIAGGESVLGAAGAHSTSIPFAALDAADPDVIVVAPCGFGLARTLAEMPALAALPGWSQLRAVREGRVFVADGNLYFNRSGPLLFETPEILAEILHPAAFPPRHEGAAWRRYAATG